MSVVFITRSAKASGSVTIYARVQCRNPKINLRVATPLQVDAKIWKGYPTGKEWKEFVLSPAGEDVDNALLLIKRNVGYQLKKGVGMTLEDLTKICHDACFAKQEEAERKRREEEAAAEAERNRMTFKKYRALYLQQVKSGGRSTYTGKNFAPSTIVAINVCFNRIKELETKKRKTYDFDDIDMQFYRDFTAYLKSKGYNLNSLGKTIKVVKTVMRCAEEDGYHSNHNYMAHSFKAPKMDADAIYLTREEIQKITDLDLSKEADGYELARDIFLIGVWTAQRVSDYNNLQREDIRKETIRSWDEDGNMSERTVRTIHITQQKTGKKVVIPCNKELRKVLDKYPDKLPHLSEQKINDYMKEIGKKCGFEDMVDIRSSKGGVMSTESFPKWQLIHTHTARRTGATLMFLSGMNVYDICKITGHSNIKTLERYIKANELETVKKITDTYDYFK